MATKILKLNDTNSRKQMRIVSEGMPSNALREISPTRIAVAYVGADWMQYVSIPPLTEIVLAPVLGSNPRAIIEIVKRLGWENVYFMDNLHAKLYIGNDSAAVGSFNLSANGLSSFGLEELGFVVDDRAILDQLNEVFERFKSLAMKAYPTIAAKQARLKELQLIENRAEAERLIRRETTTRLLQDFTPTSDEDFYVCWYHGNATLRHDVIESKIPAADAENFDSVIKKCMTFLEADKLRQYGWILCWRANVNGLPNGSTKPYWLFIDEIVSNGADDEIYTKVAIERKDKLPPTPPFELNDETIPALRIVLASNRFPEMLETFSDTWCIAPTIPLLRPFVDAVRSQIGRA